MTTRPVMSVTMTVLSPPRYAAATPKWMETWARETRAMLRAEFGKPVEPFVEVWREEHWSGYERVAFAGSFYDRG